MFHASTGMSSGEFLQCHDVLIFLKHLVLGIMLSDDILLFSFQTFNCHTASFIVVLSSKKPCFTLLHTSNFPLEFYSIKIQNLASNPYWMHQIISHAGGNKTKVARNKGWL